MDKISLLIAILSVLLRRLIEKVIKARQNSDSNFDRILMTYVLLSVGAAVFLVIIYWIYRQLTKIQSEEKEGCTEKTIRRNYRRSKIYVGRIYKKRWQSRFSINFRVREALRCRKFQLQTRYLYKKLTEKKNQTGLMNLEEIKFPVFKN